MGLGLQKGRQCVIIKLMTRSRDSILFAIIVVFAVVGVLALTSASFGLFEDDLSPLKVLLRQLVFGLGLGAVLFFIADKINYRFWHKTAFWF